MLINGLWIGIIPNSLPKLTIVEEALIAHYRFSAILIKLRYLNKGGKYMLIYVISSYTLSYSRSFYFMLL